MMMMLMKQTGLVEAVLAVRVRMVAEELVSTLSDAETCHDPWDHRYYPEGQDLWDSNRGIKLRA